MFSIQRRSVAIFICLAVTTSGSVLSAKESHVKGSEKNAAAKAVKRKPTALIGKINCYDFATPDLKDIDVVVAQIPEKISGDYFFMNLNAVKDENYYVGTFSCASNTEKPSKNLQTYSCVGDDDAGRFELSIEKNNASLKVKYINFGSPDQEGPSLSLEPESKTQALMFKGISAACR